jgi:hypothetical protein
MMVGMQTGHGVQRDASVLEGVLERVTFANPETGYTIARIDPGRGRSGPDLITAVGPLLGAQVGESLRMRGRWTSHPKYGKQFEVHAYNTVLPATVQGIQRCLGSGLIKGTGPVMAERMISHVPAVYLPPFYIAERSLAAALLRLLATRADRLAAFSDVDWDKALAWLRSRTGAAARARAGRSRQARADVAGGGADRARSGDHPPASAAAAGRRALVRRHIAA